MKKVNIQIVPSILSADFLKIGEEVKRIEEAKADAIHIDIMDGHFVPNLTMGPKMVSAIRRQTNMFLDVHLMIYNPFDWIERFIESGADRVTIHFEATENVSDTLAFIRRCGKEAGLAFNPETSESMIPKYLDQCDLVLLMTVHPGFGGQAFIPDVLKKVQFTRDLCNRLNLSKGGKVKESDQAKEVEIQVDGGINLETAKQCVQAGANVIVSGTYLFNQPNMKEAIAKMKQVVV